MKKFILSTFMLSSSVFAITECSCPPSAHDGIAVYEICGGDREGECITEFEARHSNHGGSCSYSPNDFPRK